MYLIINKYIRCNLTAYLTFIRQRECLSSLVIVAILTASYFLWHDYFHSVVGVSFIALMI